MAVYRYLVALLIMNISLSAYSSNYYGRVVDNGSPAKPIANATVSVQSMPSFVYTDSLGKFNLILTSINPAPIADHYRKISFNNGKISFSCTRLQPVRLDLFTLSGRNAATLIERSFEAGTYAFSLSALVPRGVISGLYIIAAQTGDNRYTASLLVTNSTGSIASTGRDCAIARGSSTEDKTGFAGGQLTISKMGYEPVTRSLSDAAVELGDIVMSRTAREAAIERKVDSILALMTIDEKAGQMVQTQINFTGTYLGRLTDSKIASMAIGSVFNGGSDASVGGQPNTPNAWSAAIDRTQKAVLESSRLKIPILYGQDCVHGAGEIDGCTIFPHNIGLGCTGDTALVAKVGRITAAECTGIGVRFNFAPCISSVRNERWGRTYEGFGETPEINVSMGTAYIRGLQGDGDMGKVGAIAACAKHYLGDGSTKDGVNNGETASPGPSFAIPTSGFNTLPPCTS